MPHQVAWIQAEKDIHDQRKQVVALAEKSVRIGWTYADAFKNVRKRIWFKHRDYLFATKDYPSALEYVRQCYKFAEVFDLTRSVISRGEESLSLNRTDDKGRPSAFTDQVKIGVIKFDNGSRMIAFSASPQAMAVYGGDVGLDEFAKHPNARLLWETAQARVTWNYDIAIWSSHDGEDTLFNEFAQEARSFLPSRIRRRLRFGFRRHSAGRDGACTPRQKTECSLEHLLSRHTARRHPLGLVETINRARGTKITAAQFLADCRARAREEEIFQQSYLCNPLGTASNHIVEWSAIERCRSDYEIERVHLEAEEIERRFGEFSRYQAGRREKLIEDFVSTAFSTSLCLKKDRRFRLGFDVAASGQGDLATVYIDEANGDDLWLRALFTCRTEDWHFLKTVLVPFPGTLPARAGRGRRIRSRTPDLLGSRNALRRSVSKSKFLRQKT